MAAITYEAVAVALAYDPATGEFTWLTRSTRTRVGDKAGCSYNGYRFVKFQQKKLAAHRLAWLLTYRVWPENDIDHINGDRSDNRISNLRDVPRAINAQNTRRARKDNRSSGLLGVTLDHTQWVARIWVAGRNKYLGRFGTKDMAHAAYIAAKRQCHEGCTV